MQLSRRLRESRVVSTPSDTVNALDAISNIDIFDFSQFYFSLRSTLIKDSRNFDIFRTAFEETFLFSPSELRSAILDDGVKKSETVFTAALPSKRTDRDDKVPRDENYAAISTNRTLISWDDDTAWGKPPSASTAHTAIYSTLGVSGIQEIPASDRNEDIRRIMRIALRLRRFIATKSGIRYKKSHDGSIDFRRTLRNMVIGDTLARKKRKKSRTKIVILVDVSGSMKEYASFFVQVMYGVQRVMPRCQLFVFGTELVHVSEHFRAQSFEHVFDYVSNLLPRLNGGTKIGPCIWELIRNYPLYLDKETVPIILSDGWDTGYLELLRESLATLKARTSGLLIWLNPLLDDPGFEPTCSGLRAAIPFIDILASPEIFRSIIKFNDAFGSLYALSRLE